MINIYIEFMNMLRTNDNHQMFLEETCLVCTGTAAQDYSRWNWSFEVSYVCHICPVPPLQPPNNSIYCKIFRIWTFNGGSNF